MQQPTPYLLSLETYLQQVEDQLTLQRGFTPEHITRANRATVTDTSQRILWHYLQTIKGCKTGNKPPATAAQEVLALHWEAVFEDPEYLK